MTGNQNDPLLTVDAAAEYLGYKPNTIRNKVSLGQLPATKIGRTLRFRLSDLNRWIEEQSATRNAAA